MKVCFLAGTLGRGGAERQLVFMLESLIRRNIDVRLLCLTKGEAFEDDVKRLGIDVEWVGKSENRIQRVIKVARSASAWSADVIQSSHFYTNIYAGLAARINRSVSIGAIRSDLTSEVAINGIYSKGQLRLPHHLIANSRIAITRAISSGIAEDRIDYVPNVVKGSRVDAASTSNGNGASRISFVGRLSKEKRPEVFVALASRLSKELPQHQLDFRIAGDGPLKEKVTQLARSESEVGTRISLMGQLSDPSMLYRDTDILIVTSEYEGTPNVVLEAMAHGIPVIASAVGGVPELIGDDRGVLVQPGDFEGFVSASKALITDKTKRRRLGANAQTYAVDTRSPSKLGDKLISIYTKLLGKEND